ncbi:MAG TPA: aldehyde dehydrogenase family protein [Thermoleophilaceae bacterium]|nr:aldehyde dehydrogenase family protein [Thermoleophilaceae bacterium]
MSQAALEDVGRVQPFWAALPLADRARYLRRCAQVILDSLDPLADLIAGETGLPRAEVLSTQLLTSVDALHRTARNGPDALADRRVGLPLLTRPKRAYLVCEPLGVIGVRGAAAEPWTLPLQEVAIALMCGNGVLLDSPPLGERIRWVFERAGVPEGVVCEVAPGALDEIGVRRVLGPPSGGKGPMLVLADAPRGHTVSGALWGGFATGGRSPSGVARVYVVREAAEPFVERLVARAETLGSGEVAPPEDPGELQRMVDEAVGQGAELRCGGADGAGFPPAVLTGVTDEMRVAREPPRGPVLAVTVVEDEEAGIAAASSAPWAVSASVWTCDRARGTRIARLLPAERVWVNDHMHWGSGRLRSRAGFHECVQVRLVGWEPSHTGDAWWFPYDEHLARALEAASRIVYGRDDDKPAALRRGLGPLLRVGTRMLRR